MLQKNPHLKYYISAIIIGIMIVFAVIYLLRVDKFAEASWWDASWLYRKSIEVTNTSGGTLQDFQIKILNNVNLSSDIGLGKIQNNLNDLRFTDLNGNPLSYWIEDTTSTSVDVWLKITNIPESGTNVYMYYGNSIADPGKSQIGTIDFPALSCKSILASDGSSGSGNYFVDFTNGYLPDAEQVYCDMTENDGGWMLVKPSMVSSVVTRYVSVSTSTDANGGASYTFTHQDIGCDSNDTGATVQVTSIIQWDKVRAKHSIVSGSSYCWSMDGTGNYGGQRTNSNLETFLVGTDVVQGCVLSCNTSPFVIPPLTRCDDTEQNYAIYNVSSEESFELISRRKNRTTLSGPALGLSCNDLNMTSKIESIYIKEDYLSFPSVAVGIFGSQELALGIAGVSATLGSRTGTFVSPVLYYNFDEGYGTTTYNYVSTTSNGIITGASFTNDGKFGKALIFNGDDYIESANSNSLDLVQDVSFSTWYKCAPGLHGIVSSATAGRLINLHRTSPGTTFALIVGSDGLGWYNSGNATFSNDGVDPCDNNWHFAVLTINNSGQIKLYKDTKLVKSASGGSLTYSSYPLTIGTYDMASRFFNGMLDEVKVYNYALTADQVNVDYNQGMAMVMGQSGTSTSANSEYCVPGDTSYCVAPIAEYKFEKKSGTLAYDTSGNNNNGTINGAVSTIGKFGNAMSFDGSNNSINGLGNFGKSNVLTISMWFKTTNASWDVLFGQANVQEGNTPASFMGALAINGNGQIRAELWTGALGAITSSANLKDGAWHQVVLVGNTSVQYLYIDNVLIGSRAGTIDNSWWTYSFIGTGYDVTTRGFPSNAWHYFNGSIDDVKIYNYARTPAQIAWDFNKGAPIVHYKFDECSDVTIHDESGNGEDGIVTIGANGSQNAAGTCVDNDTLHAWYNGRAGKYKSSLSLDGTDDYINAGLNTVIGTSSFSMSGWFKTGSHSTYGGGFVMGTAVTNGFAWLGWCNTADVGTSNSIGGGFYGRNYGSGITDSAWHHMVLTFSGGVNGTAKLYIDGVPKITDTNYTPNIGSGVVYFGKDPTGTPYWYNGQIDEAKIFNYELTSQQVQDLYAGNAIKFN